MISCRDGGEKITRRNDKLKTEIKMQKKPSENESD